MASAAVRRTLVVLAALVPTLAASAAGAPPLRHPQDDNRREVTVRATADGFVPARLDARVNEILAITLIAEGAVHGFAIDAYRVAKRVTPGTAVKLEIRADQAGTFAYYCALTGADGQQHDERGELVVRR